MTGEGPGEARSSRQARPGPRAGHLGRGPRSGAKGGPPSALPDLRKGRPRRPSAPPARGDGSCSPAGSSETPASRGRKGGGRALLPLDPRAFPPLPPPRPLARRPVPRLPPQPPSQSPAAAPPRTAPEAAASFRPVSRSSRPPTRLLGLAGSAAAASLPGSASLSQAAILCSIVTKELGAGNGEGKSGGGREHGGGKERKPAR